MSDWSANQPNRRGATGRERRGNGYDYYHRDARSSDRTSAQRPQQPGGGPGAAGQGAPRKKKRWGRRIGITLLVIVLLLVGLVIYVDSSLQRTGALDDYQGRVDDTAGTNWLLVGSDSRQGLDESQREELSAGDAGGRRTDTMMMLHVPAGGGDPSLISLPRDSSVPIPGHGRNKLNAAFAIGGPKLLVRTVENVTGVHMDHYAEIGLGGFASLVESVGGVEMCLDQPLNDPKAGIDLEQGCQQLNGQQALGFVRSRAYPEGDLQRIENQRKLLGALIDKATSPATLLNPLRIFPLITATGDTFLLDNGDHLWHLVGLARAMGDISAGNGVTGTVPIAGFSTLNGQSVVKWDSSRASRLFEAIANDQPIPANTLGG
ncbi:LCP family protein [Actinopolyspora saharensis]|uniref:Cell envelope-related function transcriptional attenuator common domain-containing protein n=1 Tax=Actinopolyspora saharensis TaxID=995062 RepID=A0A1H0ZMW6_9ACTN|nr:LCP family protein [Actinopolyspora saharensis]SDQ28742.1 cell envelope-related function transcriptional attenuator common domain-containing protein [Actinopolyspora saharensis]